MSPQPGKPSGQGLSVDELIPLAYEELRSLARSLMRAEREGHTLQTTALVHEACLRLLRLDRFRGSDPAAFFSLAARAMRQVLLDHARKARSLKRGGGAHRVPFEVLESEIGSSFQYPGLDLIALDEALERLGAHDARKMRVVELLFFGGLDRGEAAEVLGVTRRTVDRDWCYSRLWLIREMREAPTEGGGAAGPCE